MRDGPDTKAETRESRLPTLDGFRAISIGLVLGAHCADVSNFPSSWRGKWPFDGGLGVRFFFVISGFIITWLLLREAARDDRISLRGFWLRRAVRILPACGALLLVLVFLQWLTPWHLTPLQWLTTLTFTSNYNVTCPWLPSHLWSLAVEEQFYLLWPITFFLLKPWHRSSPSLLFLGASIIICALFQWIGLDSRSPLLLEHSFLRCEDSIAFGCMGAILLWHHRPRLASLFQNRRIGMVSLALAAIVVPKALQVLRLCPPGDVPGFTAIQGAGLVLVLLWSQTDQDYPLFRLLQLKPVVLIGLWSYSIYLWQQIFCGNAEVTFGLGFAPWWLKMPGWFVPSFLCGVFSYYCIEQPIRSRFKARRRAKS
jgi:peptidoglycan/LPS O-acetylase OafA/YrhL